MRCACAISKSESKKMAQDNASFSVDLLSSDIAKLEDLVDDFLDMAQVASRYEAYLKDMNLVEIEKDITRYSNQVDKLPVGDERRKVAQKTWKCCCRAKTAIWNCDGIFRRHAGRWI